VSERLGIISDTHGKAPRARAAIELLMARGATRIVHLGDVGSEAVLDLLAGIESTVVFGNCDDERSLARYAQHLGLHVVHPGAIIEINPVVVTKAGDVLALDAKVSFDDSALFRHKDLEALRDDTEMDPKELDAVNHDLNYVALDGEIGCMVNGAGLAMATMDIIKLYGSSPANFLDVGGTADAARVTEAFRIITSDTNVKGILVNIFGGIAKCDMIANGIVAASKNLDLKVPLVVRLEGTNVELGKKILAESGLAIIPADNLADAAQKAVAAVRNA
jgi:succinyl-CoA synthetase beta subunit